MTPFFGLILLLLATIITLLASSGGCASNQLNEELNNGLFENYTSIVPGYSTIINNDLFPSPSPSNLPRSTASSFFSQFSTMPLFLVATVVAAVVNF